MTIGHKPGDRYKNLVKMPDEPGGCWEWAGSVNKRTGYGKKQWQGKTLLAHRWLWQMLFGKIEDGMTIDHKCRNRKCVNPLHLEPVTQTENCRRGAGTKLTAEQARAIKYYPDKTSSVRKRLATQCGVSPQLVNDIWTGRAWADI